MNRIVKKFKELKKLKRKAFIPYITAGDPDISTTAKLVIALERSGADIIELGIPFSDPLADGPTIQAASQRALKRGITLAKILKMVKGLRNTTPIPLVFMTYYNPVFKYGPEKFMKDADLSGVDGVIIPDLPYEEAHSWIRLARRHEIASIFLAAPTSTVKRMKDITKGSTGFIYYVSLTGVTGIRKRLPDEISSKVRSLKSMTDKPVCVGFGISDARQAAEVAKISDGIIVGSAIVKIIEKNLNSKASIVSKVSNFSKILAKAAHGV